MKHYSDFNKLYDKVLYMWGGATSKELNHTEKILEIKINKYKIKIFNDTFLRKQKRNITNINNVFLV